MLFDIEMDDGRFIVGYLVPDSFSAIPTIRLSSAGRELLRLESNEARPSIVAAGRHETGRVGFCLGGPDTLDLSSLAELEIQDVATGLVIYRRRRPGTFADFKLLRLEAYHHRFSSLDEEIGKRFLLAFPAADQLGRETSTQALLMKGSRSLFVSARVPYKQFEYSIDDAFKTILIAQDPYLELAQMLLALQHPAPPQTVDLREQFALAECKRYFSDVNLANLRDLRRAFTLLPSELEFTLSNPLARLLAAKNAEESQNLSYIPAALNTLSHFEIVGIREQTASYAAPLAELLEIPAEDLTVAAPATTALEMAQSLKGIAPVAMLLELDLLLYMHIASAHGAVLENAS